MRFTEHDLKAATVAIREQEPLQPDVHRRTRPVVCLSEDETGKLYDTRVSTQLANGKPIIHKSR